jgi:hypothetical protein
MKKALLIPLTLVISVALAERVNENETLPYNI